MPYWQIPEPAPDFRRLEKVVRRQGEPDRVPFIELYADPEPMEAYLGRLMPDFCVEPFEDFEAYHSGTLEFFHRLGYDYVPSRVPVFTELGRISAEDTAGSRMPRLWAREGHGLITNWEEFERYPWPRPEHVNFSPVEYNVKHMPEGMKTIVHTASVYEMLPWLMGETAFFFALYDQPDLVEAMWNRVGEIMLSVCRQASEIPGVGAVFFGDDLGYKTATMIKPELLRRYVFPWHRRIVEAVHARGLPFLLHSCGNLSEVMGDLIDTVGIDARHSFEDIIQPAADAKQLYGDRIAILGGVDMDMLCRSSEPEVRDYVRDLLDRCAPGGGYALGTGNTLANYVPLPNFLAMLEEGYNYGR